MNNVYLAPSPVVPPFLIVSGISNATKAIVTVSTTNSYVVGQLLYFSVPFTYGMFQINELTGQILAVDVTNLIFTVNINTTQFDVFVTPSMFQEQPATVSPAGSRNLYNTTTEPFHSVNGGVGN